MIDFVWQARMRMIPLKYALEKHLVTTKADYYNQP